MKATTTTNQLKAKQLAAFARHLADQRVAQTRSALRVAKSLGIATDQLHALEKWDETGLPAAAYRVGLLNKYAGLLGVPPIQPAHPVRTRIRHSPETPRRQLIISQVITTAALGLAAVAVLIYVLSLARGLIAHPKLVLRSPAQDGALQTDHIEVSGQVNPETIVQVNGEAVSVDEHSQFQDTVYLRHGQNEVVVSAINSLGRRTEITRRLYVSNR